MSAAAVLTLLSATHPPIFGMHETLGGRDANGFTEVTQLCGARPRLWSGDFGFSTHPNDSIRYRARLLEKMGALQAQGVLIALSWHQCNPVVDEPCDFKSGVQKPLSDREWADLLTAGSPLNIRWRNAVDRLAQRLSSLQGQGAAVLLRPYHEANIPGFWWADPNAERPKALWRQLRRYFEGEWALHNLVWVWSVSYHPKYWRRVEDYYPGDASVDVIGLDAYPPTREGQPDYASAWVTLKALAPDKPLALTEVSRLPTQREFEVRPWAYVVPWGRNLLFRDNTVADICSACSPITRP